MTCPRFKSTKTPNNSACEEMAKHISDKRLKAAEGNPDAQVIVLTGKQIKFWFDHRRRVENHGTYKPLRPGLRGAKKGEAHARHAGAPSAMGIGGECDSLGRLGHGFHDADGSLPSTSGVGGQHLEEASNNLPSWMQSFQLLPLMSTMVYKTYTPGTVIIERGEYSDELYFLLKGEVSVTDMNGTPVASLNQGSYFGEMGVIGKGPRTATVTAAAHCHVFVMHGNVARDMLKQEPMASKEIVAKATDRLLQLLKSYETSGQILKHEARPNILRYEVHTANDRIINEGDLSDDFYFLSSGRVEVSKQGNSITILNQGSFFGEMAALCPGARTTSVTALEECEVFVLPGQILRTLAEGDPSMGNEIGEILRQVVFARACDTMMALTDSKSIRPISADVAVSTSTMKTELKMALFQLLKCIHNVKCVISGD